MEDSRFLDQGARKMDHAPLDMQQLQVREF